jgi:single-strand DNA-binding protein
MSHAVPTSGINLSLLAGTLSRRPEVRVLPSGTTVVELQLSVRPASGPTESVPVAWFDAPPAALEWPEGHAVVVVGRVRRRFFRSGGATASRTEVVATSIVPATRRAAVGKAIDAALATVHAAIGG